MVAFTHILCPIDFSETSARALRYATASATWYEARLTVLHVARVFDESMQSSFRVRGRGSRTYLSRGEIVAEVRKSIEQAGAATLNPALLLDEGKPNE